MATKSPVKQAVEPSAATDIVTNAIAPDIDLESAIAESLLADINWSKVKAAMLKIAKRRFMDWLSSGDRPVVISPFPELAQLEGGTNE